MPTQSNARRDVEFCSLAGAPAGRVRKYSEKEMEQDHLNALQKVVAVQRAEAGGAKKRARAAQRPEKARKKYRRDYAQGNDIRDNGIHTRGKGRAGSSSSQDAAEAGPSTPSTPSIVNSSAGACIIVGQVEISAMDLRTYVDTESNPSYIDPPSIESSSTVPKQNYSPTPPYAETPPNSPQIENPLPPPCGNFKGSLNNQEAIFKVSKALSSLQKPGEGREEYQNSLKSTEKAFANTTKPSTQPQSDHISGATSSTIKRLPITDLLNETRPDEHAKPPQLTTMMTTSSGLPITDTGLGKLQCEMPAGLQPHIKRSTSSRRKLSKIASLGQARGASEPALVRASDNKSASGPRNDRMPLEGRVVAQKLAMVGKILIPKSDAPDSMVMLSINPLLSQNAPDFFRFYSQTAGAGEVSVLCFGLPDVTWPGHQIRNISRGDIDAFCALKQTIWDCFCVFLRRGPGSAVFRVVVAAPARRVADDMGTVSSKTEYNRVSASWKGPVHQNPAATNSELEHFPPSSQVAVSSARKSNSQKALPIGFQPTLRSRDAGPPRQSKHSTTESPAAPAMNTTRKMLRDRLPPLQIASIPRYQHPLAIPPAMAYRQDKQARETPAAIQIAVRIQENEHSRFSRPYSKSILLSEVTAMDFFTWFARSTGYAYPSGPPELKFILKDALPESKSARIKRGDEANFQLMKADIKPHFERAKALMPELTEFAILVTVPGWTVERLSDE